MKRAAARGVTLVEVLIVLSIMALIAGVGATVVFPQWKKSRIKTAVMTAAEIKTQAQQYMQLENQASDACPTIKDLIDNKQIDGKKSDDPWGQPYKIHCEGDEVTVVSAGSDRKENTPDDIKDDFKDADIKRVAGL